MSICYQAGHRRQSRVRKQPYKRGSDKSVMPDKVALLLMLENAGLCVQRRSVLRKICIAPCLNTGIASMCLALSMLHHGLCLDVFTAHIVKTAFYSHTKQSAQGFNLQQLLSVKVLFIVEIVLGDQYFILTNIGEDYWIVFCQTAACW